MFKQIIGRLLHRPRQANKYDFGHVLIVGGAPGMVGAPYLAGMAALRTGAGLATIASTPEVINKLEERTVELLTLRLPEDVTAAADKIEEYIRQRYVSVVAIGPGISKDFARLAIELVGRIDLPVVCDAAAVTIFHNQADHLKRAKNDVILTPHDGEFYKMTGYKLPTELEKRREIVRTWARRYKVILVAKGNPTLVASPEGYVYVNPTGSPALATAGTGDVLTGMLAGLIAQNMTPVQAAETATYLHGIAGDMAAQDQTEAGVIASDVIDKIPTALQKTARKT